MPSLVLAHTEMADVELFTHSPTTPVTAREWWPQSCIGFTSGGMWEVRSGRGRAVLAPGQLLVGAGGAEHECRHPAGLGDRVLVISFRDEVDVGAELSLPVGPRLHAVHRELRRELKSSEMQAGQVEELVKVLLELVILGGEAAPRPSARTRDLVRRWRHRIDGGYRDPAFDVMAAAGAGLSRSRLVHAFRDVAGTTPHRYLGSQRVTDAANLLVSTGMPVTEVCFASGFGSLARFYATFSEAFGMAPGAYRARYRRA